MINIEIMQTAWFFIIGFLFLGYSILDGFDLGAGILFPFVSENDSDKQNIIDSIWPVWDGNEVWLITAGAALFAAFPDAYATIFSGFYLPLMLVLFALIFRAVSIEFWYYDTERKNIWGWALFAGSLIPSLLFGMALGNLITGISLDKGLNYTGGFFDLLNPFSLLTGLVGLAAIVHQGGRYLAAKTAGDLQTRVISASSKMRYIFTALFILHAGLSFVFLPQKVSCVLPWVCFALTLAAVILIKKDQGDEEAAKRNFILSSAVFAGLWAIAGSLLFPNLVNASNDSSLNITIRNGSSGELTLNIMFWIAVTGMPVVIAYSAYVYRVFKGKPGEKG